MLGRSFQPCVSIHQSRQPMAVGPASLTHHGVEPVARRECRLERRLIIACDSNTPQQNGPDMDELRAKFFSNAAGDQQSSSGAESTTARPTGDGTQSINRSSSNNAAQSAASLDSVNPYALGRQARKAFDEVWSQLSNLASPTKSLIIDETLEPTRDAEFQAEQAAYTTVLVVGATGRVGRILLRKLLLRGYTVKALVRKRPGNTRDEYGSIPAAVEIIEGDVGDAATCQEAVRGVNKVIFCAGARSTLTADLLRVDDRGVMNIAKALQDEYARQAHKQRRSEYPPDDQSPEARRARRRIYSNKSKKEIADFSQPYHQLRWDIRWVGTQEERDAAMAAIAAAAKGEAVDEGLNKPAVERWMAASKAVAEINHEDHLIFEGTLYQRGSYAEVGAPLHPYLPGKEHRTEGTEALTLRVRGDGNQYACVLMTNTGHSYIARFPTRAGFLNIRLPYSTFRPEQQGAPALNPKNINAIAIRYELKRQLSATGSGLNNRRGVARTGAAASDADNKFSLEIDWIKAVPGGEEPDFILVSSSRNAWSRQLPESDAQRTVAAKRRGEDNLRLSGLGYTILRPGQLVDEPGGYKALVFDQGDRIEQPISAADVADICLRALHEPQARNKTFDVCYEMPPDAGTTMYELVTSAPDKTGSYLKSAASTLVKNT